MFNVHDQCWKQISFIKWILIAIATVTNTKMWSTTTTKKTHKTKTTLHTQETCFQAMLRFGLAYLSQFWEQFLSHVLLKKGQGWRGNLILQPINNFSGFLPCLFSCSASPWVHVNKHANLSFKDRGIQIKHQDLKTVTMAELFFFSDNCFASQRLL